jgi:hypothetical protein
MALDAHAEAEVGRHPADHGQLLPILLTEHRDVGAHSREQLGDHGGDPVEVARPMLPLPRSETPPR